MSQNQPGSSSKAKGENLVEVILAVPAYAHPLSLLKRASLGAVHNMLSASFITSSTRYRAPAVRCTLEKRSTG